jgi:alanyl-tRNA synthetase
MTERLYYLDAESLEFEARVTEIATAGGQPGVVLDRTAFYPTSGGQPFDTGRLGDAQVLDVVDEGERIVHVVSLPLEPGTVVRGVVDAARRRDHMQQHTGQHILSAAFDRLFGNPTVSFHLGTETCTIDLARQLSPADVERAVDEANRVVWEDRPVVVRLASADEARRAGLRKESPREGELRLIEVADFDLSACGGTHVARTGAVGIIAVTGTEKVKAGLRVSFVCGRRALDQLRLLRDAVSGSLRALSVLPAELPDAIRRLQLDGKALRKRTGELQLALAGQEADRLLALASPGDTAAIVAAVVDGWDAVGLRAIASSVIARGPVQAVLATADQPVSIVVAQSGTDASAAAIVSELTSRFGGRGGGTAELAQAGGLDGAPHAVIDAAKTLIAIRREAGSRKPGATGGG